MNIRKSTDADFNSVIALWYQNMDTLFRPFQGELHTQLAEGKYFIIEEDNQIIGFASYKQMPRKKCMRIIHFCIAASHRSKGCGRTLLKAVIDEINSLDIDHNEFPIQVECILGLPNNDFWLKEGYEVARRTLEKSGKTILTIQIGE